MKKVRMMVAGVLLSLGFLVGIPHVFAEEAPGPVTIHLRIESATSTPYNNELTVSACSPDASSTPVVSAYCAVEQSGLATEWSAFGDDQFLSSINNIRNDYTNNQYWSWFSNLEYGQTSLNKHLVSPDEQLLLVIGTFPLTISISTTTPAVNSTTTISVTQFGFDSSWNGVWLPADSSLITAGEQVHSADANGHYELFISTTTQFTVYAEKTGYLRSTDIIVTPYVQLVEEPNVPATTTPPDNSPADETPSGGGGGGTSQSGFDVSKAVQFLISHQKTDGSFGSSMQTDWAAIALAAANGQNVSGVANYLLNSSPSLSSATDYERHAMALMALGINPYNGTSVNYIKKISERFDGNQIGDPALVNDDIFAIFPLVKAGYSTDDQIIKKTITFILSKQQADGSWQGSTDLTSAAIQALVLSSMSNDATQAVNRARDYVMSAKQSDNTFGSSFSTSWALQALAPLGQNVSTNGLASYQQSDGGVESISASLGTRVWATTYAIPAALGKPWATILASFTKVTEPASPLSPETPSETPAATPEENSASTTATSATIPNKQPASISQPEAGTGAQASSAVAGNFEEDQEQVSQQGIVVATTSQLAGVGLALANVGQGVGGIAPAIGAVVILLIVAVLIVAKKMAR